LNACNGIDGTAHESERVSIDAENLLFALQAQSLQIYTELAKRRNEEVKKYIFHNWIPKTTPMMGFLGIAGKNFSSFHFPGNLPRTN